jgi:hypothetical protein
MGVRITGDQHLWRFGIIPYAIDDADFPEDSPERQEIEQAIATFNQSTHLTLIPHSDTDTEPDWVVFKFNEKACASPVGRRGGAQEVSCASDLVGFDANSVVHEVLHSAGFWHEQSREDRDSFVTIDLSNVKDDSRHNFDKHVGDGDDIGAYDFVSIMHYDRRAFAKDTTVDTITPVDPSVAQVGGAVLSAGDRSGIEQLYPAKAVPGWFGWGSAGGALARASLRSATSNDLIVGWISRGRERNRAWYKLGWGMNGRGLPNSWSERLEIPVASEMPARPSLGFGMGLAVADVTGDGKLDMMMAWMADDGAETTIRHKLGRGLNPITGVASSWAPTQTIAGSLPSGARDCGIALADLDGDGSLELVLVYCLEEADANRGWLRVGTIADKTSGTVTQWSDPKELPDSFGARTNGVGIALGTFAPGGGTDLLVFWIENPSGPNRAFYRIGANLDTAGDVTDWVPDVPLPVSGRLSETSQGGGIIVTTLAGKPSMIYMFLENPLGPNRPIYRVRPWSAGSLPRRGTFGTSDSADDIEFLIEPNAAAPGTVDFRIELGPGITWHKGVWVPDGEGSEWYIEAYDEERGRATVSLWAPQVNNVQTLRLQKAKVLGFIVEVGQKALADFGLNDGDRLTLTWLKD